VEWVHLAHDWNQHSALFKMVMNCLVPWQAGNFCSSWPSKTMCHAGNYLPPETGLQKRIPLASPVSSLQSLHGHVSPAVVNYTFKCAMHGTAPDPTQRLASDCGWNLWLSHILEPEATFLGKEKGWHTCKTTYTESSSFMLLLPHRPDSSYANQVQRVLSALPDSSRRLFKKKNHNKTPAQFNKNPKSENCEG
jgi:hypothetical protein